MTPKLSEDLRHAIEERGGAPLYVVDATGMSYVVLRAEQYERVKSLVGDEADLDPREMYPAIDQVFRKDWDDPAMDVYDDYDAHRKKA